MEPYVDVYPLHMVSFGLGIEADKNDFCIYLDLLFFHIELGVTKKCQITK